MTSIAQTGFTAVALNTAVHVFIHVPDFVGKNCAVSAFVDVLAFKGATTNDSTMHFILCRVTRVSVVEEVENSFLKQEEQSNR